MSRKKFFLLCLCGGVLFAVFQFFSIRTAPALHLRLLRSAISGLLWAVLFYFLFDKIWIPVPARSLRAMRMLRAYDKTHNSPYLYKCYAQIHRPYVSERDAQDGYLYFEADNLHVVFCEYKKEIRSFDIPYEAVERVIVSKRGSMTIVSETPGNTGYYNMQAEDALWIKSFFTQKGIYYRGMAYPANKLFATEAERNGTLYFELQYCKIPPTKREIARGYGHGFWEADSLLIHIDNEQPFLADYADYFNASQLDCYGVNYYSKKQAIAILEKLRVEQPREWDVLCTWLEKAATDYNGFFFLGI